MGKFIITVVNIANVTLTTTVIIVASSHIVLLSCRCFMIFEMPEIVTYIFMAKSKILSNELVIAHHCISRVLSLLPLVINLRFWSYLNVVGIVEVQYTVDE